MFRSLNHAFPVCGKFYFDDRALLEMLEDVVQKFGLQAPRLITYPRGHFHISPLVIGGILARNFHFIFYLQTEAQRATIDVRCEDVYENRVALTNIISEHCQAAFVETVPPSPPFATPSGNYVNFKAKPMSLSQVIDRVTILGNHLGLGLARVSLIVPPPGLEDRGFDFMQLFPDGYFAIHDAKNTHDAEDFQEVDIFLKGEMSTTILNNWFPNFSEPTFLQRTFSLESLY